MHRATIERIIEALETGEHPVVPIDEVPCFARSEAQGEPHISPDVLTRIMNGLTKDDIPTFQRALQAIDEDDLAWIGFKIVYDPAAACANVDNKVTKRYGSVGSADGKDLVFFCNDAKEIVTSHSYSPRDLFQMKDVTRGPSMHNQQFDGVTWASVPLFDTVRVWLIGASDVSSEVAELAHHVGFSVNVVDDDPAYLNEMRFAQAHRHVLSDFSQLAAISGSSDDYVCVLTRGHMHDPEGCLWGSKIQAHYIGMMGCAGKNNTVHDLCIEQGLSEEQWDAIKRPIGLSFGAKTPAELAIAIVGELVDVRYRQRYSSDARAQHEIDLGR